MKFTFKYDIGIMGPSGLKFQYNGDSEQLPGPYNKTMESLIDYKPEQIAKSNPAAKDLTQYEIDLTDGKRKVSLVFKEDTIPANIKSLIVYLRSKATLLSK
jgi:hypothetical protein